STASGSSPSDRCSLQCAAHPCPLAPQSFSSDACCTAAAAVVEKEFPIFSAIVVGNLFPKIDPAQCDNHDPSFPSNGLGIWPARMIDVTRHIPSWRAINGPPLVECKHISRAARLASVGFFTGNAPPAIGSNIAPSLDRSCGEEPESGLGSANSKDGR